MRRKETPNGDRSGRPVAPDRIAGSLRVTQSLDLLASKTKALQWTHTGRGTFPLTLTPFIKVLNHTVDTHGPARRLLHQVWSQARVKLALLRWVDRNNRLSEVVKHAHGLPSLWDSTYLVAAGSGRWFVRPCVGMSSHPKVVLMWVGADHRNPSVLTDNTHRLWSFFLIYCAQPSGPEQPKVLQVSNSCYHRSELLIQGHSCLLTFSDSSD